MPKVIVPTPDLNVSVMRPIVYSIVRDVLERTGLNKDATILYPDEVEGVRQLGSAITAEDGNRFQNKTKVIVEAKETYDPARIMSTPVMQPSTKSIFSAPEVSTAIVPVYSRTELELSLQFYTRDKTVAIRWQDDIRMRLSAGRREQTHEIDYNFMIPVAYINTLRMVHGLREKQDGYGESFDEWLSKCLSARATIATDMAGNNGAWVVGERQLRVLGWFDFDLPEQLTREENPTHWVATVTYRVQYDKPIELFMCYPVTVHNQVIPPQYRSNKGMVDTHYRPRSYDNLTGYLSKFESEVSRFSLPGDGERIPYWDEFYPSHCVPSTVTVLTALTVITSDDKRLLLNLNELGERSMEGSVLDFILNSEAAYVTKEKDSVFNLALYSDDDLVNPDRFTLSTQGLITAKNDLQLRECYHVRLSVYMDWRLLSPGALDRLRKYPKVVVLLLQFLGFARSDINDGSISNRPTILDLDGLNLNLPVPKSKMQAIVNNTGIGSGNVQYRNEKASGFFTVGTFMIQANPKTAPANPADYHPEEKNPL